METPSKAQLLADLADNAHEIKAVVSELSGMLSKQEWSEAMATLYKLKAIQADIEYKLLLLANQSRT